MHDRVGRAKLCWKARHFSNFDVEEELGDLTAAGSGSVTDRRSVS
jgi:hypothetical protein